MAHILVANVFHSCEKMYSVFLLPHDAMHIAYRGLRCYGTMSDCLPSVRLLHSYETKQLLVWYIIL